MCPNLNTAMAHGITHKVSPITCTTSLINSIPCFHTYFLKIYFIVVLISTPKTSKGLFRVGFSAKVFIAPNSFAFCLPISAF